VGIFEIVSTRNRIHSPRRSGEQDYRNAVLAYSLSFRLFQWKDEIEGDWTAVVLHGSIGTSFEEDGQPPTRIHPLKSAFRHGGMVLEHVRG
jgi:hypothetical protein